MKPWFTKLSSRIRIWVWNSTWNESGWFALICGNGNPWFHSFSNLWLFFNSQKKKNSYFEALNIRKEEEFLDILGLDQSASDFETFLGQENVGELCGPRVDPNRPKMDIFQSLISTSVNVFLVRFFLKLNWHLLSVI